MILQDNKDPDLQQEYRSPDWFPFLLDGVDFQSLWEMPLEPLDAPNARGKGWSHAFLWRVKDKKLIVKRQYAFQSRTVLHPIRGIPTLQRELENIHRLGELNIPTVTPVYYGRRISVGKPQAILITEYLEGHISLHELFKEWDRSGTSLRKKQAVIKAAAALVRRLHQHQLRHHHLVAKHIFLDLNTSPVRARIIDLEAMRPFTPFRRNREADLVSFNRRSQQVSQSDKVRFLFAYLNISTWSPEAKQFARTILRKTKRKKRRYPIKP